MSVLTDVPFYTKYDGVIDKAEGVVLLAADGSQLGTQDNPIPVLGTLSPSRYPSAVWDGTARDLSQYSSIVIWCNTAPAAQRPIETSGDGINWFPQWALPSTSTNTVTSISAVGGYDVAGNRFVRLGGTGGAFLLVASN
jgi:hypothetical protein